MLLAFSLTSDGVFNHCFRAFSLKACTQKHQERIYNQVLPYCFLADFVKSLVAAFVQCGIIMLLAHRDKILARILVQYSKKHELHKADSCSTAPLLDLSHLQSLINIYSLNSARVHNMHINYC